MRRRARRRRAEDDEHVKRLIVQVALVVLVLVAVAARRRMGCTSNLERPYKGYDAAEQFVEIPAGSGTGGDRADASRTPVSSARATRSGSRCG